jgi:hypothetical protein
MSKTSPVSSSTSTSIVSSASTVSSVSAIHLCRRGVLDVYYDNETYIEKICTSYFNTEDRLRILAAILAPKPYVPLYLLEWFCTNYAKYNGPVYVKNGEAAHYLYKDALKTYTKKYFDCFKRKFHAAIVIKVGNKLEVKSTLAQLNFLRFVHSTGIYDYVRKNLSQIKAYFHCNNDVLIKKK